MNNPLPKFASLFLRFAFAALVTAGLLLLLVATKTFRRDSSQQNVTIRSMESLLPVSLPAPAPPAPPSDTPPPPENVKLPELEIEPDSVAPPLMASPQTDVDLHMKFTDFAPRKEGPREMMTFKLADLDSKPKLLNRPKFTFPDSIAKLGVEKVVVKLDVLISPEGNVKVVKVLDTPYPEFTEIARSFASHARFTVPKKDGRSVQGAFVWPVQFDL